MQTHAQRRQEAEARWEHVRARVKFQLARQQYAQGQIDAAMESASEAIALDGSSADQFLLLAHGCLEQGKTASAREAVDRAAQCAPGSAEVAYTYGLIDEAESQLEPALVHYRKARETDPKGMDYLVAEAECMTALGFHDEAAVLVSDHLGRFDSQGTLEMLLAQIALLTGDKEEALRYARTAAQAAGDNDLVIEEFGRLLSETGRHDEAVAVLKPYVTRHGEEAPVSAVAALAGSMLATGRADEARRMLQALVRRRPNDARGWSLLARAAMASQDWPTAKRCAAKVEKLAPGGSLPHLLRGYVCWMEDDLAGAREALQQALSLDKEDPLAQDLMGRVLFPKS